MILSMDEAKKVKSNICHRTACDRKNAVCWNEITFKYYCPKCARNINEANRHIVGKTIVHFPVKELVFA